MRFADLSHHATILIHDEREKVWRFIERISYGIILQMDKEVKTDTFCTQVVEIARRIERIQGQAREATSDKRPRNFGSFNGDSSESKGNFGRGHSIRPIQLAL